MAVASTVRIECARESIIVHISTEGNVDFNGLLYPRGLSKNSSCLQEYKSQPTPITYRLPLRSCNTMPTELVNKISYYSFNNNKLILYNFEYKKQFNASNFIIKYINFPPS